MNDLLDLLAEMEAPRRDCGHRVPMDDTQHAEHWLKLTCPHCGLTERGAYALLIGHGALDERHIAQFGTCWPQRWMFERTASCMTCHWPTFGIWPCRNASCATGCHASHPTPPASRKRPALYDLLNLLEDITRPAYTGPAPLHFTGRYFTPHELLAAHTEVARVRGVWSKGHPTAGTWGLGITTGWCGTAPGHRLCILQTDTRCTCRFPYLVAEWEQIGPCLCVGDLLYQANCPDCRWHHIGTENEAVTAWHDHAWPGWRDLPTLPAKLRGQMGNRMMTPKLADWLEANYPPAFRIDGAPILTDRGPHAGRSVPGYSPYGGFDLSTTQAETL